MFKYVYCFHKKKEKIHPGYFVCLIHNTQLQTQADSDIIILSVKERPIINYLRHIRIHFCLSLPKTSFSMITITHTQV